MNCPTCKGKGEMDISVTEKGATRAVRIRCIDCEGEGEITAEKLAALRRAAAMWCRCGNPSGESDFFDDGERPDIRKHHWRCHDCGRVVQVG